MPRNVVGITVFLEGTFGLLYIGDNVNIKAEVRNKSAVWEKVTEIQADIAEAWTEASRSPNCWETDAAPVFILGSDGQAHETRPTTSLAKDLAKSQEPKSSSPSSPSRRRWDNWLRPGEDHQT
eukprot:s4067_g1.t1